MQMLGFVGCVWKQKLRRGEGTARVLRDDYIGERTAHMYMRGKGTSHACASGVRLLASLTVVNLARAAGSSFEGRESKDSRSPPDGHNPTCEPNPGITNPISKFRSLPSRVRPSLVCSEPLGLPSPAREDKGFHISHQSTSPRRLTVSQKIESSPSAVRRACRQDDS
jgi:hypothetical protein